MQNPDTLFGRLGNQIILWYHYPMTILNDLTGKRFGNWIVVSFNNTKKSGKYNYQMWKCQCDCGNNKIIEGTSLKKGNSLSCGCTRKDITPRGENHGNWKGDNIGYFAIHIWLKKTFGGATICENVMCAGLSERFEWSLLKGKSYERKRENFWQLCQSCHRYYDMKEETKEKIKKSMLVIRENMRKST